jgi:Na+/melibiose symporter-like transporter
VLLGLSRKTAIFFQLLVFFANLVLFFPVSLLTRCKGKRKTLFFAFILLLFVIGVSAFAGSYPLDPYIQGIILSLLLAVPFSVFTVVPNALVSDLVYVSERKTGIQRGGMYFGVYSLATKAGVMFSSLIIPLMTAIGAEPGHAVGRSGLHFVLLAAGLFTIAGFLFLFAYHEKEITVVLDRD